MDKRENPGKMRINIKNHLISYLGDINEDMYNI